jgi:hypothetical protein
MAGAWVAPAIFRFEESGSFLKKENQNTFAL